MTLVRAELYRDGKAPTRTQAGKWSERCDWGIAKQLVAKYGVVHVGAAIRGLAGLRDAGKLGWAKPGSKMTLRALSTAKGGDHSVFHMARIAWEQQHKERTVKLPPHLKTTLRAMLA